MDLASDEYVYSMKVHKDGSSTRPSRSAKKSGSQSRRSSRCPRPKGRKKLDITEIKQSLSANCCACCCVLAEYMRETGKLVSSCLNERPAQTRLCEIFAQLARLAGCVGADCCDLLRYVFRLLCVIRD